MFAVLIQAFDQQQPFVPRRGSASKHEHTRSFDLRDGPWRPPRGERISYGARRAASENL